MDNRDEFFSEIVDDALRGKGLAKIREFESASDLHGEQSAARERSRKEIRLARLRAMSADDLLTGKTTVFYEKIGEWLDADSGRVLYRVANVSGDGMKRRFEEECTRKSGSTNLGQKRIEGNRNVPRKTSLSSMIARSFSWPTR